MEHAPGRDGSWVLKPIRLTAHAQSYFSRRGFHSDEVEQAIREGHWIPAELGRLEAAWDFPFRSLWNGTYYTTKRVRPIFVEEEAEIVVITVYIYFF